MYTVQLKSYQFDLIEHEIINVNLLPFGRGQYDALIG